MESLNLKLLEIQSNSYEFYTRIIAIGKDNLKTTVENYNYSTKVKTLIWKDERYTDINSLTEDATAKLQELSKPYRAYRVDVIDLASMSAKYSLLSYGLGDTITLISKDKGIKEKQRIVKIKEYPEEPEKNTCEIANSILSFVDMQKDFQDTSDTVNNITSDNGTIAEGAIRTTVEHITINKADIQDLNVVRQRVGTLETNKLDANEAYLKFTKIDEALIAKADVVDLTAANIKFNTAEGGTMSLQTLLSEEVFTELASVGKIVAGSSIIAEGAIGSAQISSLDVNKLNAGDISTAKFTILGANGRLKIVNNRLQVFANKADNSLYERVSLGDVNGDGTVYGLRVRGADGVTVLLDETGVKGEGITDGAITNSKVAENANISGTKLDIASVVTSINNGTTTIQGNKVFVDGKTLDVSFSTLKSTVTSQGESISSQSAQITALDGAIKLKVDNQTFNSFKSTTEGNITTINTSLTKATSDISVLQGQIALKVEKTDITTAINNIEIGGRNLFLNSEIERNTTRFLEIKTHDILSEYVGKTITVSFDLKAEINREIQVYPYQNNGISITGTRKFLAPTDKFQRFSFVDIVKDWGINNTLWTKGGIGFYDYTGVNNYTIKNIKIELGNKATDWTPAPEDVDQAISIVNTKIDNKVAEIKATTDGITSRVASSESNISTINGNVSSLTTRVSTAEQKITDSAIISTVRSSTAYQGDLNTKASQTDLNSAVSRISTAESSITQLNNKIALKVEQTDINNAIDGIEIGRNLLLDSQISPIGLRKGQEASFVSAAAATWGLFYELKFEPGDYIFSIWMKKPQNDSLAAIRFHKNNNTVDYYGKVQEKNGGWNRIEIPFKVTSASDIYGAQLYNHFFTNEYAGPVILRQLQIIKGNKVPAWTPAPEDIEVRVSTAELKLQPGSITQAISDSLSTGAKDIITVGMRLDKEGLTLSTGGKKKIQAKNSSMDFFNNNQVSVGGIGVVNYAIGVKPDGFGITAKDTGYFGLGYEIDIGGGSKGNLPAIMVDPNGVYRGAGSRIRCPIYLATPMQVESQFAFGDSAYMTTWYENNDQRKENIILAFDPAVVGTGIRLRSTTGTEIFWLRAGDDYVINARYPTKFMSNVSINGNLAVQGTKNNVIDTEHYGKRLMTAVEAPSSLYVDYGFGKTDQNGECIIYTDDVFGETVNTNMDYFVDIQEYEEGKLYPIERKPNYFRVKGTPNITFKWSLTAYRKDYELDRVEVFTEPVNMFPEEFETELNSNPAETTTKILEGEIQFNLDDYLLG